MKGEQGLDVVDDALLDQLGCATRKALLRRLEDDPHRWWRVERGERQRDSGRDGGVGVMPAGVHPPFEQRTGVVVRRLGYGQGVDVCPESDHRIGTEIDPATRLRGGGGEAKTGIGEEVRDQVGGDELAVGRLRMAVELTSELDDARGDLSHQPRQLLRAGHDRRA
jgi:hypothetical protein